MRIILSFIHPQSYISLGIPILMTIVSLFFSMKAFLIWFQILALFVWVFRNTEKSYLENQRNYLSPADGLVKSIDYDVMENGSSWTKITIVTRQLDSHMQYAPIAGSLQISRSTNNISGSAGQIHAMIGQFLDQFLCVSTITTSIRDAGNDLECIVKSKVSLDNQYFSAIQQISTAPIIDKTAPLLVFNVLSVLGNIFTEVYIPTGTSIRVLTGQTMISGETVLAQKAQHSVVQQPLINNHTQNLQRHARDLNSDNDYSPDTGLHTSHPIDPHLGGVTNTQKADDQVQNVHNGDFKTQNSGGNDDDSELGNGFEI